MSETVTEQGTAGIGGVPRHGPPAFDTGKHNSEEAPTRSPDLPPPPRPRRVPTGQPAGPALGRPSAEGGGGRGRSSHVHGAGGGGALRTPPSDPAALRGPLHDYCRGTPGGRAPRGSLSRRDGAGPASAGRAARLATLDE